MRWHVVDSLSTPEQLFCSHLSSWAHYLQEFGETVNAECLSDLGSPGSDYINRRLPHEGMEKDPDVLFVHDQYARCASWPAAQRIAQVASVHSPMPWEVRSSDGSPAYDCVISSIPWMVEAARAAGYRAEYMPLAFDTRARSCGMGVKRDLGCIFVGSVGPNHVRRTQLLEELKDVVTVLPPVFGREYFRTLARAKVVLNVHAEWARGAANNMRMFEATGMGAALVSDGEGPGRLWPCDHEGFKRVWSIEDMRERREPLSLWLSLLQGAENPGDEARGITLNRHTYESRIPQLVDIARSL